MRTLLARVLRRVAPRTVEGLADLAEVRRREGELVGVVAGLKGRQAELERRIEELSRELEEARAEIDESRRDARRVAELYDLAFERLSASGSVK